MLCKQLINFSLLQQQILLPKILSEEVEVMLNSHN